MAAITALDGVEWLGTKLKVNKAADKAADKAIRIWDKSGQIWLKNHINYKIYYFDTKVYYDLKCFLFYFGLKELSAFL